jgi:hypothetical protein
MNDFLYLYRGGQFPTGTPEQMQNRMQKWMTWMKELGDKGHIKDIGHPLEQSGKVVKAQKAVTESIRRRRDLTAGIAGAGEDLAQAADHLRVLIDRRIR